MYVYVYVYIYTYIYIYTHIYVYTYLSLYIHIYIYMYTHVCTRPAEACAGSLASLGADAAPDASWPGPPDYEGIEVLSPMVRGACYDIL